MEIKERILLGSQHAFMRYGIKAMTMDEISKNLGVSKKTIYQYFKDKNDLVLQGLEHHMKLETKKMDEMFQESKNAIHEMVLVSKHIKSSFLEMNPAVILDLKKFYPEAWLYFVDHKEECITSSIRSNLIRGKEDGYYRGNINVEILSRFRVEQIELGFNPSAFPKDLFSSFEVQLELLNHFLMGVVTPKGLELFNKYLEDNV